MTHKLPGHKDRCLQDWLQRFLSTHFLVFYCRLWKWLCLPRFKTHLLIFRLVRRFLANRPAHRIISFTVMLLYSFNFISISCRNQTLLLEFEGIFVNWVEDRKLSANLMGMFGTFFMFFFLSPVLFIIFFNCVFEVVYIIYTNNLSCWWMPGCNYGNYFLTKISPYILRSISANNFSVSRSCVGKWSAKQTYSEAATRGVL